MDLFEKCEGFYNSDALAQSLGYPVSPHTAMTMGLYPYFIALDQTEGTEVTINGKRLIMIGSNNYLGLTTHPKVREAAIQAIRDYGTSCTGSRFLNGTLRLHHELEEKLADYIGQEKALVFSTGYQTNLGTISAMIGRQDTVIIDKEDHASIVDGCRMALGTLKRFRHNDVADLERVLQSCPDDTGKLVVVDGVFSMGGEIAPLPEIAPVCKKFGARLMVDDAHALGVIGGGRGTAAHYGMTKSDVDLVMGTFSKSFASIGGVIAGSEAVIHWIQHFARSLMFSASLPAPNVASVLAALEIMKAEPERVDRVNAIAERMRQGYRSLGYTIGNSQTPIIPIIIGDQMKTIMVWKALMEAGVYTNVALPPAVPEDMSLLRTSYMATHTDDQMDRVLEIFAKVGKEMGATA
jgi:8-amino-7-oxononanoate synthase